MAEGRLRVGLIGTGLVGVVIAQALQAAGHLVVARTSGDSEDSLEVMLPLAKVKSESEVIAEADLILLAVEDGDLQSLMEDFSERSLWRSGTLVMHFAAESGFEILRPAMEEGVIPLAVSPAMSFTGTSLDLGRIRESFFAVSAPNVALPIAEALVIEMGAEPMVIADELRPMFAEAVAVAGNFSAMIVNQAVGLLLEAGVENPSAVIAPVVRSAVDQALSKGHRQIDPGDLIGES